MNLQELIELAILDAMGLLDEREQSAFEAAFRTATPPIQAQVRREQTRLSRIEALLPDVTPPAGLRAAVLEAVRASVASAPLDTSEQLTPIMLKSRAVSPWWRAGAWGMAAAAVVLGFTTFTWKAQYEGLQRIAQSDKALQDMSKQFGEKYVTDVLLAPDTKRVVFHAVAPEFKGEASVFVHPEWKEVKFFAKSVATPDGRNYRLAIVDDNDKVVESLGTFTSNGELFSRSLAVKAAAARHLAIVRASEKTGEDEILSKADLKS